MCQSAKPEPTQQRVRELLDYDHVKGVLTWRMTCGEYASHA